MSERANFRGSNPPSRGPPRGRGRGGGASGGGGPGGGAGGGAQHQHHHHHSSTTEKPKKENILDLGKYLNKEIRVKFNGGREGMSVCFVL